MLFVCGVSMRVLMMGSIECVNDIIIRVSTMSKEGREALYVEELLYRGTMELDWVW